MITPQLHHAEASFFAENEAGERVVYQEQQGETALRIMVRWRRLVAAEPDTEAVHGAGRKQ